MTEAIALLRAEADRTSITATSKRVGISRSAASMLLSGTYGADTERAEAKIMAALARATCPHLGRDIALTECRSTAAEPLRTGSREAIRQWQACRNCPQSTMFKENAR